MRLGASGHEQVEIEQARRAKPRLAGLRRLPQRVDGLAGTILARPRQPPPCRFPQVAHRPLLADHHPGAAPRHRPGERRTATARGDDVGAHVAERIDSPVPPDDSGEAAEPTPRDVFEEDALDRLLRAEAEHLVERR